MKIKEVEQGWKVELNDNVGYVGEYGWQGVYYKDHDAWANNSGVVYIPEYGFENEEQNAGELFEFYAKSSVANQIAENPYVATADTGVTYTKQDFLNICAGNEDWAYDLFCCVDWQSPETLFDEWLEDEEFSEDFDKWCEEHKLEV
jgi:hypothetical protein